MRAQFLQISLFRTFPLVDAKPNSICFAFDLLTLFKITYSSFLDFEPQTLSSTTSFVIFYPIIKHVKCPCLSCPAALGQKSCN